MPTDSICFEELMTALRIVQSKRGAHLKSSLQGRLRRLEDKIEDAIAWEMMVSPMVREKEHFDKEPLGR